MHLKIQKAKSEPESLGSFGPSRWNTPSPSERSQDLGVLCSESCWQREGRRGHSFCWVRFLWGSPGRTRGQSRPPERGWRQGRPGRARVPGGINGRISPPPPNDLLPDATRNQLPASPARQSPRSPTTGWGCMSAGSRAPEPPNGGPGWRVTDKRIGGVGPGPPGAARRRRPRRGRRGSGRARGGCEQGPGGARWVWGAPGSPTSRQRRHCRSHD